MKLKLGFSTCPNDTFMFDALVHGKIDTGAYEFEVVMADILHLNRMAMEGSLDMVKLSYNAFGRVTDRYTLLEAGSAMGQGCGPLLIANDPERLAKLDGRAPKIAIPGRYTTANLLLNFYAPHWTDREEMLFHEVMPAVASGQVDAGVIIHENRFTYQDHGLHCLQDLGQYWEDQTGLPIPLGAIAARSSMGAAVIGDLNRIMRQSVEYAFADRRSSEAFVKAHAQEMDPEVMQAHIRLYVNEFSVDMGAQGHAAVDRLLLEGKKMGLYDYSH